MKARWAIVAAGLCLSFGIADASANKTWRLRMDGFGPVTVGMTSEQVKNVNGVRVIEETASPTEGCWYLRGQDELLGVSFMIIQGQVARIEIASAKVMSVSGVGLGSSEQQIKEHYGRRLVLEPYGDTADSGKYMTLRSKDGKFGIRVEIQSGEVRRFYAGPWKHLRYVEGCA